mgnify:CR=1 FL=1
MRTRKVGSFFVDTEIEVVLPDSATMMMTQIVQWLLLPDALVYASKQGAYLIEQDKLSFLEVIQGIWVYLFKFDLASRLGFVYSNYPTMECLGGHLSKCEHGDIEVSVIYTFSKKDCYRAFAKALGQSLCRGNATAERLEAEFGAILALPKVEVVWAVQEYLLRLVQANPQRKEEKEMVEKTNLQWLWDLRRAVGRNQGICIKGGTLAELRTKAFEILGLEEDPKVDVATIVELLEEFVAPKFNKYGELNMRPDTENQSDIYAKFAEPQKEEDPWQMRGLVIDKFFGELWIEVSDLWRNPHRSAIAQFKSGLSERIESLPFLIQKGPFLLCLHGMLAAYHHDDDPAWSDLEDKVLECIQGELLGALLNLNLES